MISFLDTNKRPWGQFDVLISGGGSLVKQLIIHPGKSISYQYHEHREELWNIISGTGCVLLGNQVFFVNPGSQFRVPVKTKHHVINIHDTEDLVVIEIWRGNHLSEEDIIRL